MFFLKDLNWARSQQVSGWSPTERDKISIYKDSSIKLKTYFFYTPDTAGPFTASEMTAYLRLFARTGRLTLAMYFATK